MYENTLIALEIFYNLTYVQVDLLTCTFHLINQFIRCILPALDSDSNCKMPNCTKTKLKDSSSDILHLNELRHD